MDDILKLAKDYSKKRHLDLLPHGNNNILENLDFIYDENWENQGVPYPYEILTYSLSSGNLSSVQPTLCHLIDFITVQHQVGCESVMLVKKDVLVLNGQKLVQGMQVHEQLMLQIMPQRIAAHHLLRLFVQLAIDKNQWLIKIERK